MKFAVLVFLYLVNTAVYATSFNEGLSAYQKKNYSKAHEIWLRLLESDTHISDRFVLETVSREEKSFAQYALGLMYWQGLGIKQNYTEARHWLELAANNGHGDAALKLAVLLLEGKAGVKDSQNAFQWMLRSARWGIVEAQYNLGLMYQQGNGVEKDLDQAKKWLEQAAQSGMIIAQKQLDVITQQEGSGVKLPVDSSEAAASYAIQLAASNEKKLAIKLLKKYQKDDVTLKVITKLVNQVPWYAVVVCCFKDSSLARTHLSTLPDSLKQGKPFVIKLSNSDNL